MSTPAPTLELPVAVPGGVTPAQDFVSQDVSAWFGDHKVLERVSIRMEAQRVTALIGPSGCGKSTFLRILNRMHELVPGAQLSGSVFLDGDDIYGAGQRPIEVRKRVGMVFQKPNPFPAMSIYQNVISGLSLSGRRVRKNDSLVEECLTRAGLWDEVKNRLGNPGGALSGGQQQRLCIARAIAPRPEVLLTVVIVTHTLQQAQRVSTSCAFFLAAENEPGYVVETGTTTQIFENPRDPRTADYVHGRFG